MINSSNTLLYSFLCSNLRELLPNLHKNPQRADKRRRREDDVGRIREGRRHTGSKASRFNWHPLIGNYQAYPLVET